MINWDAGKFLYFHFHKNNENTFADYLHFRCNCVSDAKRQCFYKFHFQFQFHLQCVRTEKWRKKIAKVEKNHYICVFICHN